MSVSNPVSDSSQSGFTGFRVGSKKVLCEIESAANEITHMKAKTTLGTCNV